MGERFDRPRPAWLKRFDTPGIGHNNGPAFDQSWEMWVWKRAVAKAWKTPPREVALRRIARAEGLGLTYREYTAVLMDRGRTLNTMLVPADALVAPKAVSRDRKLAVEEAARPGVVETFARLRGCRIWVYADARELDDGPEATRAAGERLRAAVGDRIERVCLAPTPMGGRRIDAIRARAATLKKMLAADGLVPGECFLVGTSHDDYYLAETAGVPLFKWAEDYFSENSPT